ncbi:MAG: NAD(P)H-hydrate dehydratase [Candidatus Riflebacteria bacterium]|jgi:NAD(P)H-hydrate epimerase|nr:NAD(P)H-hydrate dehydratase [Candidatus Riflebacteria bacterium]
MRLFTAEEMRAADQHAIEKVGISALVLMENAGIKALLTIEKILGGLKGKRFTVVCGRGNNGGDGLVIARHLFNNDIAVHVFVTATPDEMTPEARANCEILLRTGLNPVLLKEPQDIDRLRIAMEFSECLVDCLYGTGVKGDIEGFPAEIVRAMNDTRAVKIAIDLPSGLCATTGHVSNPCMVANYTVTLGVPKVGLFVLPGKRAAGEIWIADIGLPAVSAASPGSSHFLVTSGLVSSIVPERDDCIHKGDAGKILIVAGSNDYQGAGVMASYGALRSGTGIVTLALPDCLEGKISCQVLPEVILNFLPSSDGGFDLSTEKCLELAGRFRTVLAGPGWGRGDSRAMALENLLQHWNGVAVLDADALNLVADSDILASSPARILITPHLAEMARLCQTTVAEVAENQVEIARRFAREKKVTVVLKSAVTIIADQRGVVYVNSRPNSGLAKGGAGDLLAGLIAGLAATGISELHAAIAGVYLVSEAAELAKTELGADSMSISEVASYIPRAFKSIRGEVLPENR